MKKQNKKSIARIQRFLEEMEWLFNLNNFDKDISFKDVDTDENIAAEIKYDEKYQYVGIKIYPTFFKQDIFYQRKILLHELCHSITIPSKKAMNDLLDGKLMTPDRIKEINELETSKIENILHGLLIGRLRYAKEAYKNYLKKK